MTNQYRDPEQLAATVLESMSDAFLALDGGWRIVYANAMAERVLGKRRTELLGRVLWDAYPELSQDVARGHHERALRSGSVARFEHFCTALDKWMHVHAHPTPDGLAIYFADVTEQKRNEEALRASNQRLAGVLGSIAEGCITFDEQFRFVEINPAARRMIFADRPIQELVGKVIWDVYPQTKGSEFDLQYQRALRDRTAVHFEAKGSIVDKWFEVHACPRNGFLEVYLRDITDRKRAEEELRRSEEECRRVKEEAEAANRAKDHFLAVLSHELRTPLTPVVMTVAALEIDPGLPPNVRADLAMIRRNIGLETRLIDDLLDISRVIDGKMTLMIQPVEVHVLLNSVTDILASDIRTKRLRVEWDLRAADDHVQGDAARLQQVFWNLVKNAIKFTPDGGLITIRTWNEGPRRLFIQVQDSGIGIEPAALPRIFNAFDQGTDHAVTRRYGGLGLGLAISKAIVEMLGGSIRAESDGKQTGARMTIELTCSGGVERLINRIENRGGDDDAKGALRVLLVEDHLDTLSALRKLLESGGFVVTTAMTVEAGFNLAEVHAFDVLVSDIGLPDGTGLDLMRRLRAAGHAFPGIAVTGYGMDRDVKSSLEVGFAAHLTKPVDLSQLAALIRRLTRRPGRGDGQRTSSRDAIDSL
jgi:PAS domain S-box-containing protein